jgi:acyl carrier protein
MEIETKLQEVFRDVFQDETLVILPEMTAGDVDKWDSITHLIMISKVEEVFNVSFRLKELIKLKNVGDLITLLKEKTE